MPPKVITKKEAIQKSQHPYMKPRKRGDAKAAAIEASLAEELTPEQEYEQAMSQLKDKSPPQEDTATPAITLTIEKDETAVNSAKPLPAPTPTSTTPANTEVQKTVRQKNTLRTFEVVQLADYVRKEWERFNGRTDDYFAHEASNALGFLITKKQISKLVADLRIPRKGARIRGAGTAKQPVAMRADVQLLAEEMLRFFGRHGYKSEPIEEMLKDFKAQHAAALTEPDEGEPST